MEGEGEVLVVAWKESYDWSCSAVECISVVDDDELWTDA